MPLDFHELPFVRSNLVGLQVPFVSRSLGSDPRLAVLYLPDFDSITVITDVEAE